MSLKCPTTILCLVFSMYSMGSNGSRGTPSQMRNGIRRPLRQRLVSPFRVPFERGPVIIRVNQSAAGRRSQILSLSQSHRYQ
ncbi:uncharacterized protein BJ212DRAFT_911771 [Suillus subaureus]|uniref:Secreted protein n=1 Tax=Suillus subaureus TaxID=48587 RepID=A0A9P7JGN0_9AGAM|nr:uncharacterized protein BJ212DRAFT_911771 [Suillus subaureus]KAG1821633.1 hypothetical protein BJ212DRAFT_911771 [Suillus subaureus]